MNRCVAKTAEGKRCKRTKTTSEGTCVQHISMFPNRCMFTSPRFNRCTAVAPYSKDYCNGHQALREPIIIEDSDDEIITVHDSDSEYIPESESESEYTVESDSDDSEWLPYDHKKQKRPVIVEGVDLPMILNGGFHMTTREIFNMRNISVAGGGSESICDCHEQDELNTAFYDYIEDEENPNVMLIHDTLVKTRDMPADKFNELLDYLEEIIKLQ